MAWDKSQVGSSQPSLTKLPLSQNPSQDDGVLPLGPPGRAEPSAPKAAFHWIKCLFWMRQKE